MIIALSIIIGLILLIAIYKLLTADSCKKCGWKMEWSGYRDLWECPRCGYIEE